VGTDMATPRQIEANRRNARHSTGPRTRAGKDASRLNACKHGLTASMATAARHLHHEADPSDLIKALTGLTPDAAILDAAIRLAACERLVEACAEALSDAIQQPRLDAARLLQFDRYGRRAARLRHLALLDLACQRSEWPPSPRPLNPVMSTGQATDRPGAVPHLPVPDPPEPRRSRPSLRRDVRRREASPTKRTQSAPTANEILDSFDRMSRLRPRTVPGISAAPLLALPGSEGLPRGDEGQGASGPSLSNPDKAAPPILIDSRKDPAPHDPTARERPARLQDDPRWADGGDHMPSNEEPRALGPRIGTLHEPLIPPARLIETRSFRPDPLARPERKGPKRSLGPPHRPQD
jgi:hypothetical protein